MLIDYREFVEEHIVFDPAEKQYKIKQDQTLPCKFLNDSNQCSIYSVRPGMSFFMLQI